MRAVVVDDEALAREELEALLREVGGVEVVASCGNALEALPAVRRERPDVLFLDVQMPAISGFELLATFGRPHFTVVFASPADAPRLLAALGPLRPNRYA